MLAESIGPRGGNSSAIQTTMVYMGHGSIFHLLMPYFGIAPVHSIHWSFFINSCVNDTVFMKIPNHLILMIEFKFNPKRN